MGRRHQVKGLEGLVDKGHEHRKQEQERQGKLNFKIIIAKWKKVVTALQQRDRLPGSLDSFRRGKPRPRKESSTYGPQQM